MPQAATNLEPVVRYVVCVTDRGNELSVLRGKLYRLVEPDPRDPPTDIRIIDETGEDYPYDRSWFRELDVPRSVAEALEAA